MEKRSLEDVVKEQRALDAEMQRILPLVGSAMSTWSQLEMSLCQVFINSAFPSSWDRTNGVGAAIFYSPNSFEARVRLIQDVLVHKYTWATTHSDKTEGDYIIKSWSAIRERIKRKQSRRNMLAHGVAMARHDEDGTTFGITLPAELYVFENRKLLTDKEVVEFIKGCKWLIDVVRSFDKCLLHINDHLNEHRRFPDNEAYASLKIELDKLLAAHP